MYLFYRKHFLPKFQSTAHNFELRKNVERRGQILRWKRGELHNEKFREPVFTDVR